MARLRESLYVQREPPEMPKKVVATEWRCACLGAICCSQTSVKNSSTMASWGELGQIAILQADIAAAAIRRELSEDVDVPEFSPEIFCIMNQGGSDATLILSDTLFGGDTDIAWSSPAAHLFKWSFDSYYSFTHGHMPPEAVQRQFVAALRRFA